MKSKLCKNLFHTDQELNAETMVGGRRHVVAREVLDDQSASAGWGLVMCISSSYKQAADNVSKCQERTAEALVT